MTGKTITYAMTMNVEAFDCLAESIMIHSKEMKRLQGFGQCVPAWLRAWKAGRFPELEPEGFRQMWLSGRGEKRRVNLSITSELSEILREWKHEAHEVTQCPETTAMALAAMAYALVSARNVEPSTP